MEKVLITNGLLRKSLASARSLGEKGIFVYSADTTYFTPTAFSKYCKKSFIYKNPNENPKEFYIWLLSTIKKYKITVLFPMDDDVMDVVIQNYNELKALCKVLLPPKESYDIARDKGKTSAYAKLNNIDVPKSYNYNENEALESQNFELPIILKPPCGSGSRGFCVVNSYDEFKKIYKSYESPVIQEYLGQGERVDVCLLFDCNSNIKASFVQKEIRHFPIPYGPSTVQQSIFLNELVENSIGLMESLNWVGIAELEYILDEKENKYKLLEINPRFWNSLYLSIASGVDFPYLLYKITIDEKFNEVKSYKKDVFCKNLLFGDILHYIKNPNKKQIKPTLFEYKKDSIVDDIISKKDIMPILGLIFACFYFLFSIKMWKKIFLRGVNS